MPKLLTPRTHGILDYVTVVLFALAPSVLGLEGLPATMSYALAAIHLVMTLVTAFPLGVASVVPFPLHGMVELAVAVMLLALGLFLFEGTARVFYLVMGVVIALVWATTDYQTAPVPA